MNRIFFTGMPGFIGTRLARRLLEDGRRLLCLVYPQRGLLEKARAFAGQWGTERVELVVGDLRRPRFGLDPGTFDRMREECAEVYHLAALYNLAAPKDRSYEVNVEGTRHILGFCEGVKGLRKLVHISTIVVSGDREGLILESELECGQRFRNYYEESKYLAEVEVRRRMADLPVIVVRPAVVIGDSRSGEIDKYDGPYYMIAALARLEREGRLDVLGRLIGLGDAPALFHLIPVDFLVNALSAIAAEPASLGKTFQVVDPNELTVAQVRALILRRFDVPELPVNVPASIVRALMRVPALEGFSRVPRQVFSYFDLDNRYDSRNTRDILARAGIECPTLPSYIDTLIAYVRSHPAVRAPMVTT